MALLLVVEGAEREGNADDDDEDDDDDDVVAAAVVVVEGGGGKLLVGELHKLFHHCSTPDGGVVSFTSFNFF